MVRFQNYHRHSYYTNVRISDSVTSPEEYAKRAVELGHGILSSVEHGFQGRYFETVDVAKQYGLKPLIGAEAYWVKDRFEKDRTNCHICVLAMNEDGRLALNDAMSEANITGFYGQPRLDIPLILSLPKDDIIVTSACVAGWRYDDCEEIWKTFADHFGKNFFLEVQYHNTESQRALNKRILRMHDEYKIPIIMGCDSHMILPEQAQTRSDFLVSKGLKYEDEAGWDLDYPDGDTAYRRFATQCVLNHSQIMDAMDNTNVFLEVGEYDSPVFSTDIKMCSMHPDWTEEQKNAEYERLVWAGWDEYKSQVPPEKHDLYIGEISKEIAEVEKCKMVDYFILNHSIVQKGVENGGWITKSGRGSAVSFITNMLLGFTEVDRIAAKTKMYPERFMTATRILESGSLPDVDFNVAPVAPFAEAQKQVLGEDHAYPMIAYNKAKKSAAWKLYAKAQNVPIDQANAVSESIRKYELAVKHADEDEAERIDIRDYIGNEYYDIYEKSKDYMNLISSWSIAPCSYLLYQGSIRREVGLVKVKDNLCCLMDGHVAEEKHFLKNDLLKVSVVEAIYKMYRAVMHQDPPTVNELLAMCPPEDPVWDIYDKGCCLGINQVEKEGTAARATKYKPRTISELTAFVAAIRPGGASFYKKFESREPFSYGVKAFDAAMQTPEFPYSFPLYQEQVMKAMNYAGIDMSECYTAIKNIAKKRAEKVLAYKERFVDGFSKAIMHDEGKSEEEAIEVADSLWRVIEDASGYSFNCISGNTRLRTKDGVSKYTVEEMYKIRHGTGYAKNEGLLDLHAKYREEGYGKALSFFEDEQTIKNNKIVTIYYSGIKDVYEVATENGCSVECTMEHKFPTPNGEKRLKELAVGDVLYEQDGNGVKPSPIKSIKFKETSKVYDVEMAHPAHTFVSESGLVVSNCSHAYCVALDSLYGAWIKAHYPVQFYLEYIKIQEEKGDKDKIIAAKEEAESFFGIRIEPMRFGQDNSAIHVSPDGKNLTNSLGSIKGFNKTVGYKMYSISKCNPTNFIDVLRLMDERQLKAGVYTPLIKIDYFQRFGTQHYCEKIAWLWETCKQGEMKQLKKESLDDVMSRHAQAIANGKKKDGSDALSYTFDSKEQVYQFMYACANDYLSTENVEISIHERVQRSIEILGYPDIVTGNPNDRRLLIVTDITPIKSKRTDTVWCYRIGTKSLGTGKSARLSVRDSIYKLRGKLVPGSILYAKSLYKDDKGYWLLMDYSVQHA